MKRDTDMNNDNQTNKALANCAEKVLNKIAETGEITDGQLVILKMYKNSLKTKVSILDEIIKYGKQATEIIDSIFPIK